jgi:ubiquinone/menaquinone biosynthesis C-methylase UbiE
MAKVEMTPQDQLIRQHYKEVAGKYGASSRSSMEDDVVREKEIEWIRNTLRILQDRQQSALNVLDLGCGNGFVLQGLSELYPSCHFWGLDFSEDLLTIAQARNLPNVKLSQGDARNLLLAEDSFDFVYSERCLINILDAEEQMAALHEIARILKPGGHYLMIECFTDGLEDNNRARADCGLPSIKQAYHNRYFEKSAFLREINGLFTRAELSELERSSFHFHSNFLSSYYFVSRVLYPTIAKGDVVRNSEVAKFFSFLPPIGNYSPVQAFLWSRV